MQFNNGVTSAGVAATDEAAERLQLANGEDAWGRLLDLIPKLREQFADARATRPFTHIPKLSFRSGTVSGKRWVLLPSAAGFVDPLLSTGFALTLLGVSRLAEIVERNWESERFSPLAHSVAKKSEGELLATGRLIGSLYRNMHDFSVFASMSLLYFTAVIYSETVRRLGKPELATSFLLYDHSYFGPRCLDLFKRARHRASQFESKSLSDDVIRAIEPLNLAGLGDAMRRNWYPVDIRDLFESAWKVGATEEDIAALLDRSGFHP